MLTALPILAAEPMADKKLIEFGWDEPDTAFMRQYIDVMERTPFDGCVYHMCYAKPDGAQTGQFIWECWGTRAFAEAELAQAREDLLATPLTRFTENFMRFNTSPGDVDWFDDFAPIVNNARLAARIAREGKSRGILFDVEQYHHPLFDYARQRDAKIKSFDEYAAKVRQRGREVMQAFQAEFPDVVVLLTFGHSLPYTQAGGDKAKLPEVNYGLLAPFLDGLLDAAAGEASIVDGFELSYAYRNEQQFDEGYAMMKDQAIAFAADADKYRQRVSFGFGVWMDQDWRKLGWNTEDVQANYFSPEGFERSVRKALGRADRYVWIYAETPRWWSEEAGKSVTLPAEYDEALRRAKKPLSE
jgi:hypothetical protein